MVLVGGRLLYISVKAENADWVCPKCGNEDNIRRSRYCPECGSEMVAVLRQMRRCPNGHNIEAGRAYIYWNGKMWRIIKRDVPLAYYHWVQVAGYPNPIIMKPTDKAYLE